MENKLFSTKSYFNSLADHVWLYFAALCLIILTILALCFKTEPKFYNQGINIIPKPNQMVCGNDFYEINRRIVLVVSDSLRNDKSISYFRAKIKNSTGLNLKMVSQKPPANYIEFVLNQKEDYGSEGYLLTVKPSSVRLSANTSRGLFYGMQSLLQLMPAEIESPRKTTSAEWLIPCVEIRDSPRFRWRGMHLDVCRHFVPVENIKKHLDMMAMYKLNTFHWHLTEDQAWRIEIKKHPRLTEIGSKRVEGEGFEYGGYYSQEQIRDLVQYATDRHINIVPEIEMPGHALAALSAYPQLSCTGGPFSPRIVWGVEEDVFCAGKEETFRFLEDIISEVADLFPYEYIHIGGDECPKERWKECPRCQQRMKDEKLTNEHELQSYFIKRIEKTVLFHNRKMIGWDEILEGGLAPSATVMSWRGEQGGIEAASMGHDVVMTPGSHCYLDHYQGSSKVEPVAIGGYTLLEKVYSYEPIPAKLNPDKAHHVLGTQGNVWTEYMYTPELVEYFVYPRILALAEVCWTKPELKDFGSFLSRLDNHHVRMDLKGINYHIPLPEGPANREVFVDSSVISFQTTREMTMVYTTDGTLPHSKSKQYKHPLVFKSNTELKVATLLKTGKTDPIRTIILEKQPFLVAEKPENAHKGLKVQLTRGVFRKVAELDTVSKWHDTLQLADMKTFHQHIDYKNPSAAVITGYISVPKNRVYRFSTNADNFFIHNRLLINNEKEVKKHSRKDATVALEAGIHPVKFVVLNTVTGGWPQSWNGKWLQVSTNGKDFTDAVFY
jgi:hexosaminidase